MEHVWDTGVAYGLPRKPQCVKSRYSSIVVENWSPAADASQDIPDHSTQLRLPISRIFTEALPLASFSESTTACMFNLVQSSSLLLNRTATFYRMRLHTLLSHVSVLAVYCLPVLAV